MHHTHRRDPSVWKSEDSKLTYGGGGGKKTRERGWCTRGKRTKGLVGGRHAKKSNGDKKKRTQ